MQTIHIYDALRYVIGVRTISSSRKLFQIVFAKDGSLFVTFPYYQSGHGRVGLIHLNPTMTYPSSLIVGDNFPVTTHYVKYSHHPAGRAHFSLTGKVTSTVGKQAVPLYDANGHVFTVMLQGVDFFGEASPQDKGNPARGIVTFPFESAPVEGIKFLGMLYPERFLGQRVISVADTPWTKVVAPNGSVRPGILLNTPLVKDGQRYFLLLSAERMPTICAQREVFINLIGGFDPPDVALDHDKQTSCLMLIYPSFADLEELVRTFGTIDLVGPSPSSV